MGVFENPYCDVAYAVSFVGNEESKAVNLEAARKAMTLLKNDGILPLDPNAEQTILVCGPRAGDMDSLVGGWSSAQEGLTIADAVAEYAGENTTVVYEAEDLERIAELAEDADIIIVSVGEPSYQHDPPWGYDTLEITSSQQEILETAKQRQAHCHGGDRWPPLHPDLVRRKHQRHSGGLLSGTAGRHRHRRDALWHEQSHRQDPHPVPARYGVGQQSGGRCVL